jgi:hypothetical protein
MPMAIPSYGALMKHSATTSHPRSTLTRRECLQVGYSGVMGAALPAFTPRAERKVRSVILIFLTGGPCQLDTFDPKPEAPAEIRGGFKAIQTRSEGLLVSELLPELALRADRYAVVRSMAFDPGLAVHELATPLVLGGIDQLPPGAGLAATRNDWPCYAAGMAAACPRSDGLPHGVALPRPISSYAGQDAGLLGPRFDPWQLDFDSSSPDLGPEKVGLPLGFSIERLAHRRELLGRLDAKRRRLDAAQRFDGHRERAYRILDDGRLVRALSLRGEDPRLRDKYGRHGFGQSLLLARRLVAAGVRMVQVNMGYTVQWDFHKRNDAGARALLPPLDRAVAALLDDLESRGMIDETLVVMLGEFGRTPRFNADAGREHWTYAFPAMFAGGGVKGGLVLGRTDKIAAYPTTQSYTPADLGATVYDALGVDLATEITDLQGRPLRLNRGTPIGALFG